MRVERKKLHVLDPATPGIIVFSVPILFLRIIRSVKRVYPGILSLISDVDVTLVTVA